MITETPAAIIYSYQQGKYIYLHVPSRLVKQCGIVSGNRFLCFGRDGKLVIEQEAENGPFMGASSATSG